MPYFFIIPAYLILLLALGIVVFVTRLNETTRPASRYILAGMIGTVPGIIVANAIVTLAGIMPALVAEQVSLAEGFKQACAIFAGLALLLGPFVASVVGVVLGFSCGCWFVCKRRESN